LKIKVEVANKIPPQIESIIDIFKSHLLKIAKFVKSKIAYVIEPNKNASKGVLFSLIIK
jgi:hypothetical protein